VRPLPPGSGPGPAGEGRELTGRTRLTAEEFGALHARVRDRVPWPPGDRRDARGHITPGRVIT